MSRVTTAPSRYQTRVLPPDEWPRLVGTEADEIWPHLAPSQTVVLVVEDAGAIVGVWVALRVIHAECVWVAPSHRGKPAVAARLVTAMRDLVRGEGLRAFFTSAATDPVRELIQKLGGVVLPGEAYSIPVD